MIGIFLSLVPLVGWGVGDFVASRASKSVNHFSLTFFYSVCALFFVVPVALIVGLPEIILESLLFFVLTSVFVNAGFLFMLSGFKYGPTGLVAPIANAYAIITAATAIVFLNEKLAPVTLLGIITVVAGIVMVSYTKPGKVEHKSTRLALVFSVIALLSFGVGFAFFDKASMQSWNQNLVIFEVTNLFVAFLIWIVFQRKNRRRDFVAAARMKLNYVGAAGGGFGILGMFAALEHIGNVAIPTAIAAAAPLVTAFLAYFFDKEHLSLLQRFATVVIVGGIVLLSF